MAKLPKLTGKELAKIIEKFGFVYSHTTGSHMVYKHSEEDELQYLTIAEKK